MKTIRLSWLIIAAQLSISPTTLYAFEDDPFFEMPVVLSASRLEQPISETPVAVTSIDRELIEASGARTIPEVLRLVPGMIVGYSANEFGEEAKIVVSYHGHTDQFSRRMQVLIDGRSIYEPLLGGVAWNMLPINIKDIERIEVARGPNASTYGSNSFLGVVNIITRHAAEDPGHFVEAKAGNHDIRDFTYRYGGNNGALDYRITMSSQNDDGQDARKNISTPTTPFLYTEEKVENFDDVSANAFDYRIDYQIDNYNQLTYQGAYSKTLLEANENFAASGIKPVRESDTVNTHHFLKLETVHNSNNSFVVQYYYNLQDKDDLSTSKPVDPSIFIPGTDIFTLDLDFGLKSERHNLELTHFNQTTNDLRIVWGLSSQLDIAEAPFLLSDGSTIRRKTHRLFANAEWQMNHNNSLNLGLQVEHNNTTGTDNSPRLSLIHKINPRHSLRFGLTKATRSPFIAEEHGNSTLSKQITSGGIPIGFNLVEKQILPNPDIDHEEILSREIGYYGQFLNNRLAFNARLFRNTLNELVQLRNSIPTATDTFDGEAAQYINSNSTTTKGIELEFDLNVDKSLRLMGAASYLKVDSEDYPRDGQSDVLEVSAPKYTASLLVIKQVNEYYSGSMGLYYVDDMSWLDGSSVDSNNYSTLDLRLTRKILLGSDTAKLSLVLKNLLDEYTNYDPNPKNGPLLEQNLTGYLELSIQFM